MSKLVSPHEAIRWHPWVTRIVVGGISLLLLLGLLAETVTQCRPLSPSSPEPLAIEIAVTPGAEETRLRQRLDEDSQDVSALIALADLLTNTGRGTEAIDLYERAIRLRPDDPALRLALGRTLLLYRYYADAELQLQRAHDLDPGDPAPLYFLGQVYESRSPPDILRAREMYEQAVRTAPGSPFGRLAEQRLQQLR
jgi:cytochrome c-type biogenesis protein CcmH/NrfG